MASTILLMILFGSYILSYFMFRSLYVKDECIYGDWFYVIVFLCPIGNFVCFLGLWIGEYDVDVSISESAYRFLNRFFLLNRSK